VEVFGRYAGFTAMVPTLAGAATRCVIPEYKFKMEKLAEVMADDRMKNPNNYSVVLVSEGASFEGEEMVFSNTATDAFGHAKLGGIGDLISAKLKELSPQFNNGKRVNVVNQKLGYIVRGGEPDAIDSIVPTVYGTLAMDLIQEGVDGRLVCLRDGRYDNVPLDVVTSYKKVVDVENHYNKQRLRPNFEGFILHPMFVINGKENKV
jgi:6-phosphofructokinase 1